ncbi:MAG: DUF3021 domain-containing protein [Lachnospiraceae bacterium]|nr:DUF3021 domain-containing protein [Lachnospiraceae bacterium]
MKQQIRLIVKFLFWGISWGCTFFVCYCLCCHAFGAEAALSTILNDFVKHAIGCILVGIGFGTTPIVYVSRRIPMGAKVFIHFAVGMGVFYPVALNLGWIPFHPSQLLRTMLQFLLSCGIFAVIWGCFHLYYRNDAKKINHRLKELEQLHADKDK